MSISRSETDSSSPVETLNPKTMLGSIPWFTKRQGSESLTAQMQYMYLLRSNLRFPSYGQKLVDHSVERWYRRLILVESSQKAAINAVVNLHSVSSGQVNCPLKTVMESN